jgi:16S rRNA (guanine527-N7)-methyltransferase
MDDENLTGAKLLERLGLGARAEETVRALEERYLGAVRLGFLGPREGERLRERHLDDALGLATLRRPAEGEAWVDLGSGAGLPGLPLAAVFPGTRFTLVDSHRRRLDWVRETCAALGIANVVTVHERLEDFGRGAGRERFDVAVARALGPSPVVAELGLPLLRPKGVLVIPRGRLQAPERRALESAARLLGGQPPKVVPNVTAATVDPLGAVIMITKAAPTPMRFPRRPGIPQRVQLS